MTYMFPVQLYHKLVTLESFTLLQTPQILLGVIIGFFFSCSVPYLHDFPRDRL